MFDFIFGIVGFQFGVIIMEWNVKGIMFGVVGFWDVYICIGGYCGIEFELEQCVKNFNVINIIFEQCFGFFMMFYILVGGSVYFENMWYWVVDYFFEFEVKDGQIDVFNGCGVFIEGEGFVWGWVIVFEYLVF